VANAAGSTVVEAIVKGEDAHAEWQQQVIDTATEAEAARRYCVESGHNPQREGLKQLMERYAKQTRKLEVIGERQGHPDEEVELVTSLANVCSDYATGPSTHGQEFERKLNENLPPVVENIFDFVD
jgi:hypothetical protein